MNEFGRLLEQEIPRLRRYAFALTRNMFRADDIRGCQGKRIRLATIKDVRENSLD
jgi:hypothetical protein